MRNDEIVAHTSLRGIAACGVVLYHARLATGPTDWWAGEHLFLHAWLFVDMFFILSGFILGKKYSRGFVRGSLSGLAGESGRFWVKRAVRIYPNYFAWLLIAVLVQQVIRLHQGEPLQLDGEAGLSLLLHLALVQTVLGAPIIWNLPLWSITVEMFAYLAFPLLARLRRLGAWADLALIGGGLAVAAAISLSDTLDVVQGGESLLRGLAGFSIGLGLSGRSSPLAGRLARGGALSLAQIAAALATLAAICWDMEIVAVVGFVALVWTCSINQGALCRLLSLSVPHFLGRISFSLYLAHMPVLSLLLASVGRAERLTGLPLLSDWLWFSGLVLAISILAGTLSYNLLEKRCHAWRPFKVARAA